MEQKEINAVEMDILREIGNIGAGNATTALAKLINARIDMQVPKAEFLPIPELVKIIGSEEDIMVGVLVTLSEDVEGMMMFMMDKKSAMFLINQMMMGSGMEVNEEFGEMENSVVSEIGNIILASYLSALASLLNMKIDMSIPYVATDMAGSILSVPAIEFGRMGDDVLLIQTDFGDEIEVNGYFILIPEEKSYQKILKALNM